MISYHTIPYYAGVACAWIAGYESPSSDTFPTCLSLLLSHSPASMYLIYTFITYLAIPYHTFPESAEACYIVRQPLCNPGFVLSERGIAAWEQWVAWCYTVYTSSGGCNACHTQPCNGYIRSVIAQSGADIDLSCVVLGILLYKLDGISVHFIVLRLI